MTFPALVCDFDLTVRYSKNGEFINGPEDVELYDGIIEKIWKYRNNGYVPVGLTNQGGVAHGYKTKHDVKKEVERMEEICYERDQSWPFFAVHAALAMKDSQVSRFSRYSLDRKPRYGGLAVLAHKVEKEHQIYVDWSESIMTGDSEEDMQCAHDAGIRFIWAEKFREADYKDYKKHILVT